MSVLPIGFGSSSSSYNIDNSLRFRRSASARLSRVNGAPTSTTKGTVFGWFKRGELSSSQALVGTSGTYDTLALQSGNDIRLQSGTNGIARVTSQLFRDPTGWMPFTFSFDTTNTPGGSPKVQRLWIGLTEVTSFSSDSDGSSITSPQWFANGVTQYVGFSNNGAGGYFDGLLAQVGFIDGQELGASNFFELNDQGVIVPKSISAIRTAVAAGGGARNGWGLQGSFLAFDDTTSTTTLGYDSSQSAAIDSNAWSAVGDGNWDHFTAADHADWDMGTGDFTMEGWFKWSNTSNNYLFGRYGGPYGTLEQQGAHWRWYYANGTSYTLSSSNTPTLGQWYHIAVSRASGTLKFFIDGTQIYTGADSTNCDGTGAFGLLATGNYLASIAAYCAVSNFRVVKGTGLYTTGFTPSTSPLTAVSGTVLLCAQNSTMIDNSSSGHTITTNGNPTFSRNSHINKVNDWTPSAGISLTPGVTYDVMTDTPTNNFCTLNPLVPATYPGTLSNGNLKYSRSGSGTGYTNCYGTLAITNALAYFEVTPASGGASNNGVFGVAATLANTSTCVGWASDQWGWGWYVAKKVSNATETAYGTAAASGDVLRCAVNTLTGKVWFGNASGWFGSGDPAGGTNETFSGLPSTVFPAISGYTGLAEFDVNFGQRPFTYTPPTGFKSLCTANLPSVAIKNPKAHFDITTWVSNQTDGKTVTGLQFQPDFLWVKERGVGRSHNLFDAVRGVTKSLRTDGTDAEQTIAVSATGKLKTFNSDGYTFGADTDSSYGSVNYGTTNHVGWNWKAGGAPSTDNGAGAGNTPTEGSVKIDGTDLGSALAGSIAATRLSANTTAGFSIVTYTGTGANATVAHGLGIAPKMVIVKNKADGATSWFIWHNNLTSGAYRLAFDTGAEANSPTAWNSTAPTSSVFSVGASSNTNGNTQGMVAYCFAEIPGFSKFGKYTGNASTDGAFIYTGFRPAFLFIKGLSTGSWYLIDTKRDPYNKSKTYLLAESAGIESTSNADHDILSNGFKLRMGNASFGQSQDFIFAAFAEHPFGGGNAAPAPAR